MEKENNSLNKDDNYNKYNKYKSINIILPSHIKQSSINLNNTNIDRLEEIRQFGEASGKFLHI